MRLSHKYKFLYIAPLKTYDETKSIVAEKFEKDIEYFGYEFGE